MARHGSKALEETLARALSSAKRERCGVDEEAQKLMALYMNSWIVAPLEAALRYVRGETDADGLEPWCTR